MHPNDSPRPPRRRVRAPWRAVAPGIAGETGSPQDVQSKRARNEAQRTKASLALTTVALLLSLWYAIRNVVIADHRGVGFLAANLVFLAIVVTFAYGNVVYQLTRLGYYGRLADHGHRPNEQLGARSSTASLTVLIPSYREELQTVEQTLLSAALLRFPHKRIVLLLDDPVSSPLSPAGRALQQTIDLVGRVDQLFGELAGRYLDLQRQSEQRLRRSDWRAEAEIAELTVAWCGLADWLEGLRHNPPTRDHTDDFFLQKVLLETAAGYRERAVRLVEEAPGWTRHELLECLRTEYRMLYAMFRVDIDAFQRKAFVNLSHEPNKAMNLNSYLSLMGKSFLVQDTAEGPLLVPAGASPSGVVLTVADTDFVITLDADSLLEHHYAEILVEIMETPGNERIAVAQTPYSAIPGAGSTIERIAGATTDIQYVIHQGFTRFGATYWVGANALLRKTALDEIAEPVPGLPLMGQYIQDRTVIEDTESSIDLVDKGWRLFNYPERLAYSATPNDYGSLVIQRRRWANGGLIILPKLLRYLFAPSSSATLPEAFLRLHYLTSIAAVNVALVCMLFLPLHDVGMSMWVPLTALPYFALYGRDLRLLGYTRLDLLRVYALNLLLVPVNLGGVCKSVQQLVTGAKIPFGRTPKVNERTAAPALYHVATYAMAFFMVAVAVIDLLAGQFAFAALLAANALCLLYGAVRFIGVGATIEDVRGALSDRRTPEEPTAPPAPEEPLMVPDREWERVPASR